MSVSLPDEKSDGLDYKARQFTGLLHTIIVKNDPKTDGQAFYWGT